MFKVGYWGKRPNDDSLDSVLKQSSAWNLLLIVADKKIHQKLVKLSRQFTYE